MNFKVAASTLAITALLAGCNNSSNEVIEQDKPVDMVGLKVAFMPDIHFHDVYGDFQDGSFDGLYNHQTGQGATIRTMASQMTSTRLFNENYFAMLAALDDVVDRGIKYVALPGDFSDDGQPVHMRGLVRIFDEYREKHGLEFFAAPGNHDPNRPFTKPAGKSNYLGVDGKQQRIYSKLGSSECDGYDQDWTIVDAGHELPTICTEEVQEWGYLEIMDILSHHGFYPQEHYHYYETPYSSEQARENYSYELAKAEAAFEKRQYEICYEGDGRNNLDRANMTSCSYVPDSSYLVEPVPGLWLMAIDANVYRPKAGSTGGEDRPNDYDGSGNAGYNMMLTHKSHVVDWIADVVKAAKEQNKTLLSFSHFPMTDFYNGASEDIEDLFGEGKFQLARKPEDDTSKALAQTGLSIHVGGHMHFNDTGKKRYEIDGEIYTLFNIQAPSLAGYIPAYKVLELKANNQVEVETVIIKDVPRFNELFEHYAEEHDHLMNRVDNDEIELSSVWAREILDSQDYYELTDWHITELTRLSFLPKDWPDDLKTMLFNMNGKDMLTLSQLETDVTVCQLKAVLGDALGLEPCVESQSDDTLNEFIRDWSEAKQKATALAANEGLTLISFAEWDGTDLATDFYRLRNADELAFRDINPNRLPQYKLISEALAEITNDITAENAIEGEPTVGDIFKLRFGTLFYILDRFATGQASDNFLIDVEKGTLTDLKTVYDRESLQ